MSPKHDAPDSDAPGRAGGAALGLIVVSLVLALAVVGIGSLFP